MLAVLGVAGLALAIDKLSGDTIGPASASAAEQAPSAPTSRPKSEGASRLASVSDKLASWEQANARVAPEDAFAPQAWMAPAPGTIAPTREAPPSVNGFRVTSVLTSYGARLRREGDPADSPGRLLRIGESVSWSKASPVRVTLVSVGGEGVVVEVEGARSALRLAQGGGGHVEVAPRARPETTNAPTR